MRKYHITFTCNNQDYSFSISTVPDIDTALRAMILGQIVDIKSSYNLDEYPASNIRVRYSDDEGKTWHHYPFVI